MARVLIHSLVFPPDAVSTGYLMSDLAVELRRRGHAVSVLTSTPHYNPDAVASAQQPIRPLWGRLLGRSDFQGIPVLHVRVPRKGRRVWARINDYLQFHLLSLLASLLVVGKVDLIIAASPPLSMGFMSWLYGALRRVPSIYNVQELYPDFLVNQGIIRRGALWQALRILESFVYLHNRFLVVISEEFAETLRDRGVTEDKLAVIPNFVDTRMFRPLPRSNAFALRHGLAAHFTVLYAGNLGLSQDWRSVLEVADRLRGDLVLLLLVGDGVQRQWLERELKRRCLGNVRILSHQPREAVPEIYASCDAHLVPLKPTTAFDTFPSKVYTVMACGKPLIVSAEPTSGLARLVQRADCGQVVPPRDPQALVDAIRKAQADPDACARAGERGRDFVTRHYSPLQAGDAYDHVIRQLLERQAPQRKRWLGEGS